MNPIRSWGKDGTEAPGRTIPPGQSLENTVHVPVMAFARYWSSQASAFLRARMLALSLMFRMRLRLICLTAAMFAGPLSVLRRIRSPQPDWSADCTGGSSSHPARFSQVAGCGMNWPLSRVHWSVFLRAASTRMIASIGGLIARCRVQALSAAPFPMRRDRG